MSKELRTWRWKDMTPHKWICHLLIVWFWEDGLNLEVGFMYKMEMTAPTSHGLGGLEIVSVEFPAHWGASSGRSAKGSGVHVVFFILILSSPGTRVTEGQSSEAAGRGLPDEIGLWRRLWG